MIALLLAALFAVQQPAPGDSLLEAQTHRIAAQLRCPICQGLSIEDSPSELSLEMRSVVREQLREGKTPEQVKAYFVSKYGEWILLQPPATGFNLAVYVLPVALLVGGAAFIALLVRKWKRQPGGQSFVDDFEET